LLARANMGVQLQSTNFQPELHVEEIIRLYAGVHGLKLGKERIHQILTDIKLEDAAARNSTAFRRSATKSFWSLLCSTSRKWFC
jgi:ABC-type multidrug transport system ATPase subunit